MLAVVPEQMRLDTPEFGRFLAQNEIALTDGTPYHLAGLAEVLRPNPGLALRYLLIGGEPLREDVARRFYDNFSSALVCPQIINLYGPTECCVDATFEAVQRDFEFVTVGRPLQNVEVHILDAALRPVPINGIGEVCLGGVQVARGYCNAPALTDTCFCANPFEEGARLYRTGDRARWLPDGRVQMLGRIDQQVKVRGFRIELFEIEAALRQAAGIRDVAAGTVGTLPDLELCVWIVLEHGGEVEPLNIRQFLVERLPAAMIPTYFVQVEELPRNANGKIDHRKLPQPTESARPYRPFLPPRTETQKALTAIFANTLEVERVGISDDFLDLGGNSLKAIKVVASIHQVFQVAIGLPDLMQRRTVAELSEFLEALLWIRNSSTLPYEHSGDSETGVL
jgi:acyl-CoA synthetase (AMP-forming)/AMP-acid ligase II/acyl carrier protein